MIQVIILYKHYNFFLIERNMICVTLLQGSPIYRLISGEV